MVAFLGYTSRSVVQEMLPGRAGGTLTAGGYEARMFTYHPEAQRITVFFVAYQLKNTYDTIVWDDGIIFIIHHVVTLVTTVRCFFLCMFSSNRQTRNVSFFSVCVRIQLIIYFFRFRILLIFYFTHTPTSYIIHHT